MIQKQIKIVWLCNSKEYSTEIEAVNNWFYNCACDVYSSSTRVLNQERINILHKGIEELNDSFAALKRLYAEDRIEDKVSIEDKK